MKNAVLSGLLFAITLSILVYVSNRTLQQLKIPLSDALNPSANIANLPQMQGPVDYLPYAKLGGVYLIKHINEDGTFVYEYNPVTKQYSSEYNILRHAGTTYSLLELYEVTKYEKLLITAEKALDYLVKNVQDCESELINNAAKCLVENNEVKLGGNGLAVLAMSKHAQVTGSDKYVPTAQQLAEFILQVQSTAGEFEVHKMQINSDIPNEFISIYYPGEALFALARLYEVDKDFRWLEASHNGAYWLIRVRDANKSTSQLAHDHWLLYALNELHEDRGDNLYLEHAKKLTDAIVLAQHTNLTGGQIDWNGGFYNPPRNAPTATRVEGLSAAYQIFDRVGDEEYSKKSQISMENGVKFLIKTQMTPAKIALLKAEPLAIGGFYAALQDYSIRIDYVQHSISAIIGYENTNY